MPRIDLADFETDHELPRADHERQLVALLHRLELIQAPAADPALVMLAEAALGVSVKR